MLTAEAAGLVLKIAKGLVKLTKQIDSVLAEQVAVEAPMALPVPNLNLAPTQRQMKVGLRQLLAEPVEEENDPIAADRTEIEELLSNSPTSAQMYPFVKKYLPELASRRVLNLNSTFMTALRTARPDWVADSELAVAAFYVSSGKDFRNMSYTWRLALTVVDVLAEFGAENTSLFVRDERLQGIVGSVLRRFAEADVQTKDSTHDLLRTILRATLNGVLDAKETLDVDTEWVDGLLDAVVSARAQAADPDNFVMGLFQGKGYPLLVGAVMEVAADRLAVEEANGFKLAATTFLKDVAIIIEKQPSFEDFFDDHWGDLLRAALKSTEKHGPAMLLDEDPLLGKILSAVAGNLTSRPNNKFLTREALVGVVDAVVGTVASNPDLIDKILEEDWLGALVKSVTSTMADSGVHKTFTGDGLERMVRGVLQTFGEQPHLIIEDPGLAQRLLGDVLKSISNANVANAESLASVTVAAMLGTISEHPELLKFDYAKLVAGLAGKVAILVKQKQITSIQGQDLVKATLESLTENPQLLLDLQNNLVETVVDVVVDISGGDEGGLIAGATLVDIVRQVLSSLAVSGKAAMKNHPLEEFAEKLTGLLRAGLVRAQAELGNRISLQSLPSVLGQMVVAWAQGRIEMIDPDNGNFKRLFAELADQAQGANA